jgi:hypothetical protein
LPFTRVRGGYFWSSVSHGSGSVCFRPSEIFSFALSTLSTTASIVSPMFTTFEGWRTWPRPRHLGDVDQALDALLQLDECAVVGDRDHAALDAVADPVLLLDALPRIGLELLQAERDALLLGIEVEHLDPHPVADLHQLRRVCRPAPTTCR